MEWRIKGFRRWVLIGVITLMIAVIAGALLFLPERWLPSKGTRYLLLFEDPVDGLKVDSKVFLHGRKVGFVKDIELVEACVCGVQLRHAKSSTSIVLSTKVWIEVKAEFEGLIKSGPSCTYASLEFENPLFGEAIIKLSIKNQEDVPIEDILGSTGPNSIATIPSMIQQVKDGVEQLIKNGPRLFENIKGSLEELRGVASKLNQNKLDAFFTNGTDIMNNVAEATANLKTLAAHDGAVASALKSLQTVTDDVERKKIVASLAEAAAGLNKAVAKIDKELTSTPGGEEGSLMDRVKQTLDETQRLSRSNRAELTELISTLQGTNLQLKRVLEQLRKNPILGGGN